MRDLHFKPCSTNVQVVGLRYGDYGAVWRELHPGAPLEMRPVDDNPHDPSAIEVWFGASGGPSRIGFVPRNLTDGLRRALAVAPNTACVVHYARDDPAFLSFNFLVASPEVSCALWPPEPEDEVTKERMAGYRSFFPGERIDPEAPKDYDALVEPTFRSLKAQRPDRDDDDVWDDVDEAMTTWWVLRRAAACDAPSLEQKLGGLPYAEVGWSWPVCPGCGRETIFVAQMRDPMNPDDLVQVFECKDPDDELCHQWAQDEPERYSLVRLWRSPSPESLRRITPTSSEDILPGFAVVRLDKGDDISGMARMSTGGPGDALSVQGLDVEGWHCVFRVGDLPQEAGDLLHSDICVARHGRGQVIAFDDHG